MSDKLRRTNSVGVTEVAHLRSDTDKYNKEHERIFGENKKVFCDDCEQRICYCQCEKSPKEEEL